MKHEVTSLNTKKTLAAALKRAMEKKPLSKVTVSEIITDCGVNRKTFYYHFEDVYALLKWMMEQEAIEVVKQFDLLVNTEEVIVFVMDYIEANRHIVNCAYDSMGRDEMKRFFYTDFYDVMRSAIDAAEKELSLTIDEGFKVFLSDFFTEGLAGTMIDWIRNKQVRTREETIQYVLMICRVSIPNILMARSEGQTNVVNRLRLGGNRL